MYQLYLQRDLITAKPQYHCTTVLKCLALRRFCSYVFMNRELSGGQCCGVRFSVIRCYYQYGSNDCMDVKAVACGDKPTRIHHSALLYGNILASFSSLILSYRSRLHCFGRPNFQMQQTFSFFSDKALILPLYTTDVSNQLVNTVNNHAAKEKDISLRSGWSRAEKGSEYWSNNCEITRGNAKCVNRQLFGSPYYIKSCQKIVNAGLTVVISAGEYLLIVWYSTLLKRFNECKLNSCCSKGRMQMKELIL